MGYWTKRNGKWIYRRMYRRQEMEPEVVYVQAQPSDQLHPIGVGVSRVIQSVPERRHRTTFSNALEVLKKSGRYVFVDEPIISEVSGHEVHQNIIEEAKQPSVLANTNVLEADLESESDLSSVGKARKRTAKEAGFKFTYKPHVFDYSKVFGSDWELE